MKYASQNDILPFSDRKATQAAPLRWSSEEIVKAQCMACNGDTADVIAEALGREMSEVMRVIDNDPVQSKAKTRQAVAGVGHALAKSKF